MKTTLNYKDVDFDIEYDYFPYERDTYDTPGSPSYVEINEIKHKGDCFFEVLENNIEEIAEIILTNYESNES